MKPKRDPIVFYEFTNSCQDANFESDFLYNIIQQLHFKLFSQGYIHRNRSRSLWVLSAVSPGVGELRPEMGRGEGSEGWIFTPTGVSAGWHLTSTGVSNFHKNYPKRVAKYENLATITPKERLKMKKWYTTGVCLTFEYPTRGCAWGEKKGFKGRHIPTDSARKSHPPGCVCDSKRPWLGLVTVGQHILSYYS